MNHGYPFAGDAKASDFFTKLAHDEQQHYDFVKYQERVVRNAPREFGPVNVHLEAVDRTLAKIAHFRTTRPAMHDAIRFALDVETEVVEQYAATIMDQSNKEMAAMMKGLTLGFKEDHYKQLIEFARSCE